MTIAFLDIVDHVAKRHGLTRADISGPLGSAYIVVARREIWWLARQLTTLSYPQIGRLVDRDHTTIVAGVAKLGTEIAERPARRIEMDGIRAAIVEERDRAILRSAGATASAHDVAAIAVRVARANHPALHATGAELRALACAFIEKSTLQTGASA